MDDFSYRLRVKREQRGLNQTELANKTGMQPSAIAHFESGRRKPSFENLKILSKALNVSSDYLLGFNERTSAFYNEENLSDTDREYVQEIINMMVNKKTS
jgi:transcriptional regulator with XRE-family HTH domain